jgi:hypothetical protein
MHQPPASCPAAAGELGLPELGTEELGGRRAGGRQQGKEGLRRPTAREEEIRWPACGSTQRGRRQQQPRRTPPASYSRERAIQMQFMLEKHRKRK